MIAEEQHSELFPDGDDAESVVYGSAFLFWKSTKAYWDQVIEHLNIRAEKVFSQIRDIEFALNIVQTNPYAIDDEHSTGFDIDQSKDLRRMREFLNIKKAIYLADIKRTENEQYASLIGLSEYAEKRRLGGISDRLWKAASSRHSSSLDYETIRSKKDRDDKLIEKESYLMKRKIDQYYRMRDMLEKQNLQQSYVPEDDLSDDTQSEEVSEPEEIPLVILKEIESEYPFYEEVTDDPEYADREQDVFIESDESVDDEASSAESSGTSSEESFDTTDCAFVPDEVTAETVTEQADTYHSNEQTSEEQTSEDRTVIEQTSEGTVPEQDASDIELDDCELIFDENSNEETISDNFTGDNQ